MPPATRQVRHHLCTGVVGATGLIPDFTQHQIEIRFAEPWLVTSGFDAGRGECRDNRRRAE